MDFARAFDRFASLFRNETPRLAPGGYVWVPLARVEGDESQYPPPERITAAMLREVDATYNPAQRAAPVVYSWTDPEPEYADLATARSGSAHKVGELNPPAGWIDETQFDGLTLWGKVRDVGGRFVKLVSAGFERASVGIYNSMAEADGKPYLRHWALIASQPPGTTNLGKISDYTGNLGIAFREDGDTPFITRNLDWGAETEEETIMEFDDKAKETLRELIQTGVKEGLDTLRSEIQSGLDAKLGAIETRVTETATQAQAAVKAATEAGEAAVVRELGARVDTLVGEGFIPPAERDDEVTLLRALDTEKREARIEKIKTRKPHVFGSNKSEGEPAKPIPTESFMVERDFTSLSPTDPVVERITRELLAEAGGDSKKFAELAAQRYPYGFLAKSN